MDKSWGVASREYLAQADYQWDKAGKHVGEARADKCAGGEREACRVVVQQPCEIKSYMCQ